ncbi:Imm7 family immunity protein [Singulisphaera sp. Ch08]|uniref:Imm7 family immunity protein n=1 Tax=Singulisphaera sp. Ch08 TaxID=3120278 RepID=A0AAU7CB41_9BACT
MFEYHGWAVVHQDPYEDDNARLQQIVEELRKVITEYGDGSGVTDVRWINGHCMVWFAGCPNHRHDCVFGLFAWLAGHAPGSYGLLYIRDDESPDYNNAFEVWCLRRGRVEVRLDPFLSPCIPVLEDEHDPLKA